MQIQLQPLTRPHIQSDHRTRNFLQVPGKILPAVGLAGIGHRIKANSFNYVGQDACPNILVDDRRDIALVL